MLRKLLFWSFAIVFPLPLVLTYDSLAREPATLKLTIMLGLTAYSWWLLSILLSVRPPWLDRQVGLASIYGLHGMLGVLAIIAAFVHRDYSFAPTRIARNLGDWAFYGSVAVLCYSVFFMSGWLVDRSRLLLTVKRWLEIVFRHQFSIWVHRVNLMIVAMIWLHVHLLVRVNQLFAFMILFDLYTVTVLAIYTWKKWIAPDEYLTGTVAGNGTRGESSRRIAVELDREATELRPGDSLFLSFEGTPAVSREWHPFSVTDDNRERLTFTVRQHGDFTRRLGSVEVGTRVRLEGPFGRFESIIARQDDSTPLILLGLGVGVAPLLSLVAAHYSTRTIHLLWSVRSPDDAYYTDLLEQYRVASGGLLQVTIRVGRFPWEELTGALSAEAIAKGRYFIVGPNPAVLSTQRMLWRIGISPQRIHQERLTM